MPIYDVHTAAALKAIIFAKIFTTSCHLSIEYTFVVERSSVVVHKIITEVAVFYSNAFNTFCKS